jgi:membrane-bound metal-dependent hydrolase YbcI (DUF457 family)
VFIGHAAIALAVKRARPSIPLAALIAATFGPDVIEITLLVLWRWAKMPASFGSHSIPAIAFGAAFVGFAYWIWRRDAAGAGLLTATYASHWFADLFTGTRKPTWVGGPALGLELYEHPSIDFALEAGLFLIAWLFFWPARDRRRRPRAAQLALPIAVLLLQMVFNGAKRLFGIESLNGAVTATQRAG